MQTYRHWRLEKDDDQIVWLYFDKENASTNTLNLEVMEELDEIVDSLSDNPCKGVIIASAKKNGFIAGADIAQFNQFTDTEEAFTLLREGQAIFSKIESLKMPTVALIEGFCLGGGLELALGCRYRIAEDGSRTRLGLPEVKLGIHPGWGGSVRLPKLVGAMQGLNLVLSGHTVSAKAACKIGFVDAAVPKRHLVRAAKFYILNKPPRHQASWFQQLTQQKWMRSLLSNMMRKKLTAKINPMHYPAPFIALENWERFGVDGMEPYVQEAKTCAKLFFSETSQNLVRVFFLQERLKGLAKDNHFTPLHIHVVGAGTMGGDIAAWCALQGMHVTLQDREPAFIAPALKRAFILYQEKLKEPHLIQKALDHLVPDVEGHGIGKADVIIEAIFENLDAKRKLFELLEKKAKPEAILATNTSSIPLDEINTVLQDPSRLIGIHFFNPVAKMQLIEIVQGEKTDKSTLEKAISFARKIDRLPLPVKSSPGFLVNRILMPYLLESVALLDEGIPATVIDKAMLEFGMPMGPVTLADTVGLDICLSVAKYLSVELKMPIPTRLKEMVEKGQLGRKSGEGFYRYQQGKQLKPKEVNTNLSLEDIADRLILRMLNEAFACLREGVVEDSDLLDAGMVFGTGFAPFRGGPIHYAKSKGIHDLFQQYVKLRQLQGDQVESLKSWDERLEVL